MPDIGTPEDAALVTPHLESPSSKTRRLAIRALGAIDPAANIDPYQVAERLPQSRVKRIRDILRRKS